MSREDLNYTPLRYSLLPIHEFDFHLARSTTSYFGPILGAAERYSPEIARREVLQGTGIQKLYNKTTRPIKASLTSRDRFVQSLLTSGILFGQTELSTVKEAVINGFPEQAYVLSFLRLIEPSVAIGYSHLELLKMMSKLYELTSLQGQTL